jgi:hypothetical protein
MSWCLKTRSSRCAHSRLRSLWTALDPIPVVPSAARSALVQARVDRGIQLPALARLVKHKVPDIARRERCKPEAHAGGGAAAGRSSRLLEHSESDSGMWPSFGGAAGSIGYPGMGPATATRTTTRTNSPPGLHIAQPAACTSRSQLALRHSQAAHSARGVLRQRWQRRRRRSRRRRRHHRFRLTLNGIVVQTPPLGPPTSLHCGIPNSPYVPTAFFLANVGSSFLSPELKDKDKVSVLERL